MAWSHFSCHWAGEGAGGQGRDGDDDVLELHFAEVVLLGVVAVER